MKSARELGYRIDQTGRLLRTEGVAGVSARLRERAAANLRPASAALPIDRSDLERVAQLGVQGRQLPDPAPVLPGHPLRVAWVCVPPRPGSGGHTTLFRMVQAMADAGHGSVVYLQDRHGGSLTQHASQIRRGWPWLTVELRDLADGIDDVHALFASSWQTAYPVLASPALGVRFYFVQDYEPGFYAAGSEALLAEATYGFGFHAITAGVWLAQLLRGRYGTAADHFDFGCDLTSYRVDDSSSGHQRRTGVCLYSRPSTPRRAHELAMLALELFARRRPDIDIHLFGVRYERVTRPPGNACGRMHPGGQRGGAQSGRPRQSQRCLCFASTVRDRGCAGGARESITRSPCERRAGRREQRTRGIVDRCR
jgi:hypothetical protein